MSRIMTVQSLWVRPGQNRPGDGHYSLDVELEVAFENAAGRTVVALVQYENGRELACELTPEPEALNERDVVDAFARRVAHDALCDGGEIPPACTITFPVPVRRAFRFELHGHSGASLLGWDDPEASPPR